MPVIQVNLGDVQSFESLPSGSYLGEIDTIQLQEARQEGKFAQLQVVYTVIDGDLIGRKQSEWLSMSPKAAFRLKRWFAKFGLGDEAEITTDDDTGQLIQPDLIGSQVIFVVRPDGLMPSGETRIRTELVQVDAAPVIAAPPPRPAVARPAAAAVQVARPTRPVAAAPIAVEEVEEEEEEEAAALPSPPAPAVPSRRVLRPVAAATPAAVQPIRRQIR